MSNFEIRPFQPGNEHEIVRLLQLVFKGRPHFDARAIGYIVDLLSLPGRLNAADMLLKEALNEFEDYNVNIITSLFVRNHPIGRVLSSNGFLNNMEKINIFLGAEEQNELNNSIPSRIHFT